GDHRSRNRVYKNFRHTIKKNPVVNVLPQTTIQSLSIVRSRTQIKRLPKTGDNRITWLSWFGILFLISSFWLFLFRQLCRKGE
ncbi:LOW QUALITY PROTEIN: predicted protein, partial [Enterococcus faecalis T2]